MAVTHSTNHLTKIWKEIIDVFPLLAAMMHKTLMAMMTEPYELMDK